MTRSWDDEWAHFKGLNFFGRLFASEQKKAIKDAVRCVPRTVSVLDFGCGSGRTMAMFGELGFTGITGLDVSPSAVRLCRGKNAVLYDGGKAPFPDGAFYLVFADGVLEHYEDFAPIVAEMCRLASHRVIITQPNHFSFYGKLLKNRKAVREFTYGPSDFREAFSRHGFEVALERGFNFNETWMFSFVRKAEAE